MRQYKGFWIALIAVPLLALSGWRGRAYAQQASPPPSNYGGPFIANPIPPEEAKRDFQLREKFCRTHPEHCIAPYNVPPSLNMDHGPYAPPGPTAICHKDPNNLSKPICVDQ